MDPASTTLPEGPAAPSADAPGLNFATTDLELQRATLRREPGRIAAVTLVAPPAAAGRPPHLTVRDGPTLLEVPDLPAHRGHPVTRTHTHSHTHGDVKKNKTRGQRTRRVN